MKRPLPYKRNDHYHIYETVRMRVIKSLMRVGGSVAPRKRAKPAPGGSLGMSGYVMILQKFILRCVPPLKKRKNISKQFLFFALCEVIPYLGNPPCLEVLHRGVHRQIQSVQLGKGGVNVHNYKQVWPSGEPHTFF